jgi:hypothetical protein
MSDWRKVETGQEETFEKGEGEAHQQKKMEESLLGRREV